MSSKNGDELPDFLAGVTAQHPNNAGIKSAEMKNAHIEVSPAKGITFVGADVISGDTNICLDPRATKFINKILKEPDIEKVIDERDELLLKEGKRREASAAGGSHSPLEEHHKELARQLDVIVAAGVKPNKSDLVKKYTNENPDLSKHYEALYKGLSRNSR